MRLRTISRRANSRSVNGNGARVFGLRPKRYGSSYELAATVCSARFVGLIWEALVASMLGGLRSCILQRWPQFRSMAPQKLDAAVLARTDGGTCSVRSLARW